nr:hypothetical protein [Devosia riboflavina]
MAAAQAVEHYEIARHGIANNLGRVAGPQRGRRIVRCDTAGGGRHRSKALQRSQGSAQREGCLV